MISFSTATNVSHRYADQRTVFETFGRRILDSDPISEQCVWCDPNRGLGGLSLLPIRIWPGVLFYVFRFEGQTGAGKSYSMVGYGANKECRCALVCPSARGSCPFPAKRSSRESLQPSQSSQKIINAEMRPIQMQI